ncbi:MAG: protein translocase subunit SecD [Endomicrobium sp.]|jgi:protein-export membrane protein SecD|nr:protein translocase subunit SecD [Endomicrobium sp.]
MIKKIDCKSFIIGMLLFFSILALWPSCKWMMMHDEKKEQAEKEKDPILNKVLKLGLDLKGGTHLLLEVDLSKLGENVKIKDAVDKAVEIIRHRIDQFGIAEPMVAKQGDKWIVVQLPGIKNSKAARDLIGKTALLEFRIVNTSKDAARVLELISIKGITPEHYRENLEMYPDIRAVMPKDASIFESKEGEYYVLDKALLTGLFLKNAKVEFDEFGCSRVFVEFTREGARIFESITARNKDKSLAIVLDGFVQSAPLIRSTIPNGKAVIEGNFNSEDARFLATILRSGALPVSIKVIEERTIGPSLGDDSIKKGLTSSIIGILVVFIFMIVYYRFSGFIADVALTLNLMVLMAIMAYFQFTLTLPGVAGIALMLAMSVDSNVLILERVREELYIGKTPRIAVDTAYKKVFWTIFDANFTTLIAAIFLFQFGMGPIKGFAVTLSIGLIISMFTSVVVTKFIYEFLFRKGFLLKMKV